MALNNYANLKTALANWLGRTDLVNDIPDFIKLAENDFNAKFVSAGFNKMVNFLDFDADAETELLPTGFLGANAVYINASPKVSLQYVTPNQAFDMYGSSVVGQPVAYTILNDKIHFYPIPDGTYSIRMYYRDCIWNISIKHVKTISAMAICFLKRGRTKLKNRHQFIEGTDGEQVVPGSGKRAAALGHVPAAGS